MQLRETFGEDAALYDRMRPGYPAALFDDLAALTVGARVLEIGPGTGQATASLLERGYRITAIELSSSLAAVLRAGFGERVSVHVGDFERFRSADAFDLVFSATAFHWIDPAVALLRVADVLRPGGALATVRTDHILGGTVPFFDAA